MIEKVVSRPAVSVASLTATSIFSRFMRAARSRDVLVIQPRMGWGDPRVMRQALQTLKSTTADCIGTLTLDSYTRTGDYQTPLACLSRSESVNGYPIVSHSTDTTKAMLCGIYDESFPVQVRHGTPLPQTIFRRMLEIGLDATEGGPASYSLPYGRISLSQATKAWTEACHLMATETECPHIESFGGCMMGQLCPPSLLIAVSVLECLFFKSCGIRSVSLSYAQGSSYDQDRAALRVLRESARQFLHGMDWHIVVYTYMGIFPETESGSARLIAESARLARESGCERLIVKTRAEKRQIPSLTDNLDALRVARRAARHAGPAQKLSVNQQSHYEVIKEEASSIIEATLNLSADVSDALLQAFKRGILDIPYCLHADNLGKARGGIDEDGCLCWINPGNVPVKTPGVARYLQSASALLKQLSFVSSRYDQTSDVYAVAES